VFPLAPYTLPLTPFVRVHPRPKCLRDLCAFAREESLAEAAKYAKEQKVTREVFEGEAAEEAWGGL
jgi:hypothetical protein